MDSGPLTLSFDKVAMDGPAAPCATHGGAIGADWRPYGRWAMQHVDTGDCVAKLLVNGEPGYLAWLCSGKGAGFRGRDVGGWIDGCYESFTAAAAALSASRSAM